MIDVKEFAKEAKEISQSHGFYLDENELSIPVQVSLFHSEVSEVLEEYRHGRELNDIYYDESLSPHGIPVELADIIIRVLGYCEAVGIDIEHAMILKQKYNSSRPYRHGGRRC